MRRANLDVALGDPIGQELFQYLPDPALCELGPLLPSHPLWELAGRRHALQARELGAGHGTPRQIDRAIRPARILTFLVSQTVPPERAPVPLPPVTAHDPEAGLLPPPLCLSGDGALLRGLRRDSNLGGSWKDLLSLVEELHTIDRPVEDEGPKFENGQI